MNVVAASEVRNLVRVVRPSQIVNNFNFGFKLMIEDEIESLVQVLLKPDSAPKATTVAPTRLLCRFRDRDASGRVSEFVTHSLASRVEEVKSNTRVDIAHKTWYCP